MNRERKREKEREREKERMRERLIERERQRETDRSTQDEMKITTRIIYNYNIITFKSKNKTRRTILKILITRPNKFLKSNLTNKISIIKISKLFIII